MFYLTPKYRTRWCTGKEKTANRHYGLTNRRPRQSDGILGFCKPRGLISSLLSSCSFLQVNCPRRKRQVLLTDDASEFSSWRYSVKEVASNTDAVCGESHVQYVGRSSDLLANEKIKTKSIVNVRKTVRPLQSTVSDLENVVITIPSNSASLCAEIQSRSSTSG